MELTWQARPQALPVAGVVGLGAAGKALGERLLEEPKLAFRALAWDQGLVLLGDELPWVSGLIWLGREPDAPGLYLPTQVASTVDPSWVLQCLASQAQPPPIVVLPEPGLFFSLSHARSLDRSALQCWMKT